MAEANVKDWFDQAYKYMSRGEFASAAKCFEEVINHSGDPNASRIAERDIRWYCAPLETILKKMEECKNPIDVHKVLAELFSADSQYMESEQQPIIQAVESELTNLSSVIQVGSKVWVRLDVFNNQLENLAQAILESSKPVVLSTWLLRQFQDCDPPSDYPDHITLGVLKSGLGDYPIIIIAQKYAISRTTLAANIDSLETQIRGIGQPVSLNNLVGNLFPQELPDHAFQISTYLMGQLDSRFIEVTQGMIFLNELLRLNSESFDDIFLLSPSPITTEKLVSSSIFPSQSIQTLAPQFQVIAERQLAQNQNLRRLGQGYWISKKLERDLSTRAENYLLSEDIPHNSQDILDNVLPTESSEQVGNNLLIRLIDDALSISQNVFGVGNQIWIHVSIVKKAADKSYQQLIHSPRPLTTNDLLRSNLNLPKSFFTQILTQNFENLLLKDARFIPLSDQFLHHWRAVDPQTVHNQVAFQALKQAHKLLTREDIESLLITQGIPSPIFELTSDDRFKPFPPDRWGLKEWVSINELAYEYLLTSRQALHEIVIVGLICRDNHIKQEDAIFTPSEDSRFSQDSINRWICRHLLSAAELDLLHEELIKYGGSGRKMDILIRQVLHKDVDATDAEIKLNADERFIHLDKLWFARQAAFYVLTAKDVEMIYSTLASQVASRNAISLKELVSQAIGHDGRLTDAEVWLSKDVRFLHVHDDFWTLSIAPSPDFDRSGAGGVAIFPITEDGLLKNKSTEIGDGKLTYRQPRPKKDEETSEPRKKEYRTLTHLDILHGNLRIAGMLKHWISSEATNVHFIDEEDYEFIAYIDESGSILNIREWLEKRGLTYGDKISMQPASQQGELLIRPYGTRDEGVYQEALAHQEIEKLIEEARKVNKGFHDLMIEVMEAFDYPLHREDIYQLVNYQRTASRATISEILSLPDCPFEELRYFILVGAGTWKFDRKRKEAYDMKMQELLIENGSLQEQVVRLQSQLESQKGWTDRMQVLTEQNELFQQTITETNNKLEKLQDGKHIAELTIAELKAEINVQRGQVTILQTTIVESQKASQELQNQGNQEKAKLQEIINGLDRQIDSLQILVKETQERASLDIKEIKARQDTQAKELNQQFKLNNNLENELAIAKGAKESLQNEIDQLGADLVAAKSYAESLQEEIERLKRERAEIIGKLEMDLKEAHESTENLQKDHERLMQEGETQISRLKLELVAAQIELAQSKVIANPPAPTTFKQIMQSIITLLFHRKS